MAKGKREKGKGILAAIFCLPLAFIVYFLISYSSQSITLDRVKSVAVKTPGSEEVLFEQQSDIDFFVDMLTSSSSISTAMRDVTGEEPVYIICDRGDKRIEYKLYPTLNLSGCLLVGPESKLFVLPQETARQLMLRDEFSYLYASHFLPTLSVVSRENKYTVLPTECDWSYYKSDDELYKYTPAEFSDGNNTFAIIQGKENTLEFSASVNTTPCELSDISYISESGTEYSIKDISELDLSVDTLVSVAFTAKWSSINGARAYGEAKYKFNIMYDIPAVLELNQHDYKQGDVIVIGATHLNENEDISLKTLLDVPVMKFGMTDRSKGVALIPVGLSNTPGAYTLELNAGGDTISEVINIASLDNSDWKIIPIDSEQYNSMLSPERMNEFNETIAKATETRPEKNYFTYGSKSLKAPVSSKTAAYKFGQTVNLGIADISGDSGERTCNGVVYEVKDGTSVRSAQAGIVVYSGTLAPTGNTVIVYHGYGIYTYYYHLDNVNVREGYELNNGEIIGTAGKSGFTDGKTVLHYAISIDGVFVNPEWFY